ncbi:MAG: SLC13 family permease [Anaerovoracaceae bacterium]
MEEKSLVVQKTTKKDYISWLVTFSTPIIIMLLPLDMETVMQRYIAITAWGLLCWVTTIIPAGLTGLALPILYMFCGVVPADVAFSSWQNSMVWNTIAIVFIGIACDKSGISKRMAYSILLRMKCNLKGLIWGFAVAGMLLTFLISDSMSRAIIFITIAMGICRALGIPFKSKEASALGLAAFFGMSGPSIGILPATNAFLVSAIYKDITETPLEYLTYLLHNLLPSIAWTVLSVICVIKVLKIKNTDDFDAREILQKNKDELGIITKREIMVLTVLILCVLNYIFIGKIGLDPLIVPAVILPLFFLPKIGILTNKDFDISDVKVLFVVTGAMAVGNVASAIGLVDIFIESIGPALTQSSFTMAFGTFTIGSIANFILTPIAIVYTLTEPFVGMAMSAGMNTLPTMYSLSFATDIYIFPYEFVVFLVCFEFGLIEYKHLIKVMAWRVLCGFAIFLLICIPLWKICGIM